MDIRHYQFKHARGAITLALAHDSSRPNHVTLHNWLSNGQFYEPDVSQFMLRVIEPGDTIIDIGANQGYFTCLAAALTGETGAVLAFEPDPQNIADIRRNIGINQFRTHIEIVDRPAKDCAEQTTFYLNADNSGGNAIWDPAQFPGNVKTAEQGDKFSIVSTTVDLERKRFGLGPVKLFKIDTEGAEELILRGALQTLIDCQARFVICELHSFGLERLGCSQQSLRTLMHSMGYGAYVLGFKGGLPKFIPQDVMISTPFIPNIVFTRPEYLARYWPIEVIDPRNF